MVRPLPFMADAQRLVLAQRLSDATALIQERLGAPAPPASPAPDRHDGPTLDLTAEAIHPPRDPPQGPAPTPRSRPRFTQQAPIPARRAAARSAPAVPRGAEFLRLVHEGAAGRRAYRLYVPASGSVGPRPLLVMLHGCTQNPDDFATGTRMNEIAEESDVLVAYPEQDRSANPNLCWNWFDPAHQDGGAGEPAILAGIVEDIAGKHAVDRGRIFAAGLSAGGAMAAVLGSTRPDLFTAVGIHSGLPYASAHNVATALAVMRSGRSNGGSNRPEMPAIIFHGARDRTVHPANGDQIAGLDTGGQGLGEVIAGTANGRRFTRTRRTAHARTPAMEHWRIEGLEHAWSGGDAAGSHADPAGPDASREMMRFFLEQPPLARGG